MLLTVRQLFIKTNSTFPTVANNPVQITPPTTHIISPIGISIRADFLPPAIPFLAPTTTEGHKAMKHTRECVINTILLDSKVLHRREHRETTQESHQPPLSQDLIS
mmetsp:Transcript_21328/g.42784  ORF Transcript_21328/g.42784 Transcript_21328/m.42784 type:complete len:106 (+) Transcript_21328:570-887(+)